MLRFILSLVLLTNAYPCSINFEQLQKKNIHYIFDNTKNSINLPRRFKTSKEIHANLSPEIQSFRGLNIVASAQFSPHQFYAVLNHLKTNYCTSPEHVHVIDLREEPHFFVDHHSVSAARIDEEKDKHKFSSF